MIFEIGKNGILCRENIVPMRPVAINIGHSMSIRVRGLTKRYLSNKLGSFTLILLKKFHVKRYQHHIEFVCYQRLWVNSAHIDQRHHLIPHMVNLATNYCVYSNSFQNEFISPIYPNSSTGNPKGNESAPFSENLKTNIYCRLCPRNF